MSNPSIQLIVLDVDGVMTDGRIRIDDTGVQSREFHIQDGLGVTMWRAVGRQVGILTSKQSGAVAARAKMLGIDLIEQGKEDKLPGLERLLAAARVKAEETAFVVGYHVAGTRLHTQVTLFIETDNDGNTGNEYRNTEMCHDHTGE